MAEPRHYSGDHVELIAVVAVRGAADRLVWSATPPAAAIQDGTGRDTAQQRRDSEQQQRAPHGGPSGQQGRNTQQGRDAEHQEWDPDQPPSGQQGCDTTQ